MEVIGEVSLQCLVDFPATLVSLTASLAASKSGVIFCVYLFGYLGFPD